MKKHTVYYVIFDKYQDDLNAKRPPEKELSLWFYF